MKNRADGSMIKAFTDTQGYLQTKNLHPKLHVLDNKCYTAFKNISTAKAPTFN